MNQALMSSLSLAAVLAGPVHAQGCSGGNDGGMDATGNLCNTLNEVAAVFATASAIAPAIQITKTGSVRTQTAAPLPLIRLVKMSSKHPVPTAMPAPASRKLQATTAPSTPAKNMTTAAGSEAFCSGGAGGGMDVNGAECGETSPATEPAAVFANLH